MVRLGTPENMAVDDQETMDSIDKIRSKTKNVNPSMHSNSIDKSKI